MASFTIRDAIMQVLFKYKSPLTPKEIYDKISDSKLYTFNSKTPISVVTSELRKACEGVSIKK